MRTSYYFALNHISFNLGDPYIKNEEENGQDTFVGVGNSFYLMDVHKFSDPMGADVVDSRGSRNGFGYRHQNEPLMEFMGYFPILDEERLGIGTWANVSTANTEVWGVIPEGATGINTYTPFVGYRTVKNSLENVTKAMLIAILDNDGKRSTTVGVGTTGDKKKVFFNCLAGINTRDTSIAPWNGWTDPVGVCTPVFVSRTNNVAIVTTSPAHGMSQSYDDWGVTMNLNTGGIATSFNISTSLLPGGVPVKIIDANTFQYNSLGIDTTATAVTGIASVHVGWGGTSINLRMAIS